MRSRFAILAALALAVAVAIALFMVLREDSSPEPAAGPAGTGASEERPAKGPRGRDRRPPPPPAIELTSGRPRGGVEEIEVKAGERVEFEVTSDVADEVHVHGYDVTEALPAGKPVKVGFAATIEGVFEVESHHFGTEIAELTVAP